MIERPAEEVFDLVADARNEPRYNPRILKVEKLAAGPIGCGTRFVLMSKAVSRPMAVEYEITVYELPLSDDLVHHPTFAPYGDVESAETFEPVGDVTRVR